MVERRVVVPVPIDHWDSARSAVALVGDHLNTYSLFFPEHFVEPLIQFHFSDTDGNHDYYVGKNVLSRSYSRFFLPKDGIFNNALDLHLLRMNDTSWNIG